MDGHGTRIALEAQIYLWDGTRAPRFRVNYRNLYYFIEMCYTATLPTQGYGTKRLQEIIEDLRDER